MNNVTKIGAYNFGPFNDVEIEFDSFNCWVVQSENKTNSGQESNGGGKSALLDIVPICLMGTSIQGRDLKNYVNWYCDSNYFEVFISMNNTLNDTAIDIKRRFYNNTKSSELVLFVNGQTPKQIPSKKGVEHGVDVKAGTEYILNELLGISREDLLNYYLISREKYNPFMRVGNAEKIQIISRFSQADLVDQAISEIKEEMESRQLDLRSLENDEIKCNTEIELLSKEIETDSKKVFDEDRESNISLLQEQVQKKISDIESYEKQITITQETLVEKQDQYKRLNPLDFNEKIKKIQEGIVSRADDLDWIKNELSKDIEDETYKSLKQNKSTFVDQKKDLDYSKKEAESMIAEYEKVLKGLITCPKCQYQFLVDEEISLQQASSIIEECSEILDSLVQDIGVLDLYIKEKDQAIVDYEKVFDEKRKEYREILSHLLNENSEDQEKIEGLKSQMKQREREINDAKGEINSLEKTVEHYNKSIEDLNCGIDILTKDIVALKDQSYINKNPQRKKALKQAKQRLKDIEKSKETYLKEISLRDGWLSNFEDFKFYLANKPIQFVCHKVNNCLSKVDSDLFVKIDGFRLLRNGKIKQELTPIVLRNMDNPQPYKQYSGGERVRIDIATDNSFQDIINSNSKMGGLNYYQNDEVLSELDGLGIENVAKSFNSYEKTMFLVTHSGADLMHENVIKIVKENDISSVQ